MLCDIGAEKSKVPKIQKYCPKVFFNLFSLYAIEILVKPYFIKNLSLETSSTRLTVQSMYII